jgi:hypothetical protein
MNSFTLTAIGRLSGDPESVIGVRRRSLDSASPVMISIRVVAVSRVENLQRKSGSPLTVLWVRRSSPKPEKAISCSSRL